MSRLFGSGIVPGCVIAVLLFGSAAIASAAVINVDFQSTDTAEGTYQGLGAYSDLPANTYWNAGDLGILPASVSTYTSAALKDSAGGQTGVTVTLSGAISGASPWSSNSAVAYDWGKSSRPTNAFELLTDAALLPVGHGSTTLTINNLIAGGTYDLYLYQQSGKNDSCATTFTFGSVAKTATNTSAVYGGQFIENDNYVKYLGLVADGSGSISGTMAAAAPAWGAINGLQLVSSAPEPNTVVLLITGLLGILAYAWRRRR